ncbi:MAG: ATP-dependent RecD-like DNA helicase [Gammaproteobacteria bacterium]|nr:ATP-dependent RecD-like DNA helicase [Gammaproteobacteria bacterium]
MIIGFTISMSGEKLTGSIERITYHNPENGFCVLRIKVKNRHHLMTVVGNAFNIQAGAHVECEGGWINDKKHGLQFQASCIQTRLPNTLTGIEKYLSSGLIKGIGRHFAKLLVQAFGENVFEIIEKQPERLTRVSGIGRKRKKQILAAWESQKVIRDIMVFLQSYGVSTARAVKIYKTYGDQAVQIVSENPYRLALDIRGIGFKSADQIAMQLGIPKTSLIRARAGIHHVLLELSQQGHCASEINLLIEQASQLLEIPKDIIQEAIQKELSEEQLVSESFDHQIYIFLPVLYHAESFISEYLKKLSQGDVPWGYIDHQKAIPWVEKVTQLELSSSQKNAIALALKEKVSIITGGPGVGKTTIVNSILKILRAKAIRIALCAPTGRAAKRLSETTHCEAKTIHRLLGFEPGSFRFKYSQQHPLPVDFVVIDEASMIDAVLMSQLLKAIPLNAALLIVGDVDQLPSVGPGAVLSDVIESEVFPTIHLTEIFRQAANSHIIVNAHRINQGEFPFIQKQHEPTDFYFIPAEDPETIYDKLLYVVTERIPKHFGLNPIEDIQVLTPMKIGKLGTRTLNVALQLILNKANGSRVTRFGTTFSGGDKVIQNVNNYDKEIFNGDIGYVHKIDIENSILIINFLNRFVEYDFNELDEISLAYAVTIHKSQGSEYPAVVIPLTTQHYVMLARNLIYTGITRGKKLVVLIGQKKALAIAIKNKKSGIRTTKLKERLEIIKN